MSRESRKKNSIKTSTQFHLDFFVPIFKITLRGFIYKPIIVFILLRFSNGNRTNTICSAGV